jgi:hypothetical protein
MDCGARYYDPHSGLFVSPDTLVPDPTNVWDYNRFAYGNLNPLKYNDPTGHCSATAPKQGDYDSQLAYSQAQAEHTRCWGWVATIRHHWHNTDYWDNHFYDAEGFFAAVETNPAYDSALLGQLFLGYMQSEEYQAWVAQQPQPNPRSDASVNDPMCAGERACQVVVQSAVQAVQYCTDNDCVVQSLDAVSTSAAGLAALCAAGIVTAPCSIPTAGISVAAGGAGTVWTGYQVWQGNGHEIDLATAVMTFSVGVKSNPYIGFVASLYQTYWDFRRPPLENNQ